MGALQELDLKSTRFGLFIIPILITYSAWQELDLKYTTLGCVIFIVTTYSSKTLVCCRTN